MPWVELQLCLVSASLSYYFVLCYIWLDLCTNFHLGLLYFAHQTDGDQWKITETYFCEETPPSPTNSKPSVYANWEEQDGEGRNCSVLWRTDYFLRDQ